MRPTPAQSAGAIDVGAQRLLFLDDTVIDRGQTADLTRTLNPPRDVRRVFAPDKPWEALGYVWYSTLLDDNGVWKLYYAGWDMSLAPHLCLATSKDGMVWEKPNLGLVEYHGSRANNIIPVETLEGTVFMDPRATPEKRYKLIHNRNTDKETGGIYVAYSSDGLQWRIPPQRVLPLCQDAQPSVFWDDRIGKYVVFLRLSGSGGRKVGRVELDSLDDPWPYDKSAPPCYLWGEKKAPATSKEFPVVMARDKEDPENLDVYTNGAVKYAFAPNVYLAFPDLFLTYSGPEWKDRAVSDRDGPFEVQMAFSRDGVRWERIRRPYLGPDFYEGRDLRMICMGVGMVRRGPELYQCFVGLTRNHGQHHLWRKDRRNAEEWAKKDLGGVYRATQRVDGFLSLDAPYSGGTLTTRPILFQGNRLLLNINTAASGKAQVALLDPSGKTIPGFSLEDCVSINGNAIDFEVRWKGGSDVGALAGKPVRLQCKMRNTKLYAFQFVEAGRP